MKSTESEDVDFDKDAIIYFTDGVNEPRKINAYRALQAGQNIHGGDIYAEAGLSRPAPRHHSNPSPLILLLILLGQQVTSLQLQGFSLLAIRLHRRNGEFYLAF